MDLASYYVTINKFRRPKSAPSPQPALIPLEFGMKRHRSNSNSSDSYARSNSSPSMQLSTPSSSPESTQSPILESGDRSKRLRIDDTIVVETHGTNKSCEQLDDADAGGEDEGATLLDYILNRIQPIPKLQTVTELLEDEMERHDQELQISRETHQRSERQPENGC